MLLCLPLRGRYEAGKSDHSDKRSALLISRPPKLHLTLNHYKECNMIKRYTVSDGKLVLNLEEAEEGGYIVTSPLNPELITQAETIEEAFANARDASEGLEAITG